MAVAKRRWRYFVGEAGGIAGRIFGAYQEQACPFEGWDADLSNEHGGTWLEGAFRADAGWRKALDADGTARVRGNGAGGCYGRGIANNVSGHTAQHTFSQGWQFAGFVPEPEQGDTGDLVE